MYYVQSTLVLPVVVLWYRTTTSSNCKLNIYYWSTIEVRVTQSTFWGNRAVIQYLSALIAVCAPKRMHTEYLFAKYIYISYQYISGNKGSLYFHHSTPLHVNTRTITPPFHDPSVNSPSKDTGTHIGEPTFDSVALHDGRPLTLSF
jgi:hypothetical protein